MLKLTTRDKPNHNAIIILEFFNDNGYENKKTQRRCWGRDIWPRFK